jgi:tetratricopeptide (TPR) repeat protein
MTLRSDREFIRVKKSTEEINRILSAKSIKMPSSYYYNLGRYYAKENKSKYAIEQFEKALKMNPKETKYYYAICSEFGKLKEYKMVLWYFNNLLKIEPGNIWALCQKGITEGMIGRHKEALKTFKKVLSKKPRCLIECAKLYHNTGTTYRELKQYRKAAEYYDKAIKLDPKDDVALTNKGSALCRLGRHKEELLCYKKAVKVNPKNYVAWSNYGTELINKGDFSKGIKCINKAMKINPKYISEPALFSKAFALVKQRKYKLANVSIRKIVKSVKKDATDYYNLACLYSLVKNENAALKMLKKAILLDKSYRITAQRDPDFKNIKTNKAFIKLLAD